MECASGLCPGEECSLAAPPSRLFTAAVRAANWNGSAELTRTQSPSSAGPCELTPAAEARASTVQLEDGRLAATAPQPEQPIWARELFAMEAAAKAAQEESPVAWESSVAPARRGRGKPAWAGGLAAASAADAQSTCSWPASRRQLQCEQCGDKAPPRPPACEVCTAITCRACAYFDEDKILAECERLRFRRGAKATWDSGAWHAQMLDRPWSNTQKCYFKRDLASLYARENLPVQSCTRCLLAAISMMDVQSALRFWIAKLMESGQSLELEKHRRSPWPSCCPWRCD